MLESLRGTLTAGQLLGPGAEPFDGVVPFPLATDADRGDYLTVGDINHASDTMDVRLAAYPTGAMSVLFELRPAEGGDTIPQVRAQVGRDHVGPDNLPSHSRGIDLKFGMTKGEGRIVARVGDTALSDSLGPGDIQATFNLSVMRHEDTLGVRRGMFAIRFAETVTGLITPRR